MEEVIPTLFKQKVVELVAKKKNVKLGITTLVTTHIMIQTEQEGLVFCAPITEQLNEAMTDGAISALFGKMQEMYPEEVNLWMPVVKRQLQKEWCVAAGLEDTQWDPDYMEAVHEGVVYPGEEGWKEESSGKEVVKDA